MGLRNYANAPATSLAASCTNISTSITVASTAGLPIAYPYTLILDRGTASEEVVSVTAASGTVLTVTRGADSTTAFSHGVGAEVVHGISAQDPREANAHVNASSAVHGLTGSVVGTTDTQTLTNKTLGSTNTLNGFTASRVVQSDGTGKLVASSKTVPTGNLVGDSDTQTLTGKTIDLASNTLTGVASTSTAQTLSNKTMSVLSNTFNGYGANRMVVTDASGVIDGLSTLVRPSSAVVGISDTQTLTNKTISFSSNTMTGVDGSVAANSFNFVIGGVRFAGGVVTVSVAANTVSGSATVTFTSAFSGAPVVTLAAEGAGAPLWAALNSPATATNFVAAVHWSGSAAEGSGHAAVNIPTRWIAIGPA